MKGGGKKGAEKWTEDGRFRRINGVEICWNYARKGMAGKNHDGCKEPCPYKRTHGCEICGKLGHRNTEHKP